MTRCPDFDRIIDRGSLPGEKWARYAGRDILPLWVADMDFAAPEVVLEALRARLAHGVLGYTDPWPSLVEAVIDGIARDHGWRVQADWLVWLPGVVSGLNLACRATGEPGDEVFTATPVYPPFLSAPENSTRRLVSRPLVLDGGRWSWERDAVEAAIGPRTRLFLLCNPHNPVGRVFDRDELSWIADLAERHDLVICSDEIHCGLVLDEQRAHLPIAALDAAVARRTITLMAPSKTWNIPSLYCALAIIPDAGLRRRFRAQMRGIVPHVNLLGLVACEAAYRDGGPWRAALLEKMRANRARVAEAVAAMPGLHSVAPEATYLSWIDCRAAGLEKPAAFFEAGGVGLSDGAPFGAPGFVRLNFGCPPSILDSALARMASALHTRR
ncbi:putative C-S lyase [Pseudothauera nasutitermitis]|uniref:cysteine-S-conjugate beta-lyase n=1 Tax=Pseudothauera nasutitermitis TaxID=2565930 RepID=A0A4S4AW72_9RHOO|nr:PatB family C-S lyase [Pseudothauera nasutitermitis]THF63870.1 putative C-S lyase [Pseudothauera nasutitermitis]